MGTYSVKERMLLNDIIVPCYYSKLNAIKMAQCRAYYVQNGKLDRDIVVNQKGMIKDGYIGYLVLMENNVEKTDVVMLQRYEPEYRHTPTTYVFGRHNPRMKEYAWRVTDGTKGVDNLQVGNHVMVRTRYGTKVIAVTRIETLDTPPTDYRVKKVLKCFES